MTDIPRTADTIIVGAGVMGCAIAFYLARAGVRDVVVLERDAICAGNTRKSGALIRMHYQDRPEAEMAFASLPVWQNWSDAVGYDCGFTNTGAVAVVGAENAGKLRANVEMLRSVGVDTSVISPRELREMQPFLVVDDLSAAAYEPDSGYCDPVLSTESLARRAQDLGAKIYEGVRVLSLRIDDGRVTGVTTSEGEIYAERVVLAAGPWTIDLLRDAGVDTGIFPVRAEIAFVQRPPELVDGHFVYLDFRSGAYFRPTGDGLSLLGAGAVRRNIGVDEMDSFDEGSTAPVVEAIRARVRERAPVLADAPLVRGHAGLYDMSPDEKAILDRVPGADGAYMAIGFSGTGFKKAPAVGMCMSELITRGAASTVDITPFRLARFAEGRPLHGEHEYAERFPMH